MSQVAESPLTPVIPDAATVAIDFPGLSVGVAEYDEGPTGCTVIGLDRLAAVSIDVRGGIPGVHHSAAQGAEAVCLAGGSILGLAASTGVASAIYGERGSDPFRLPAVTGGVIYDFAPPGRSGVYPDAALGAAAWKARRSGAFPVGRVGAARSATCGKIGRAGWAEPGGQGAASTRAGSAQVFAFVVVNSLGVVVDRSGRVVRGNRDPETGLRSHISAPDMAFGHQRQLARFSRSSDQATTLTVVVTNATIRRQDLQQCARQVHASVARAIHPFHCPGDGDALWFLSTQEVVDPDITPTAVATVASDAVWDAVLLAVGAD